MSINIHFLAFPFDPPGNIRKHQKGFLMLSWGGGDQKGILGRDGLVSTVV